jgi:hypothetical protein
MQRKADGLMPSHRLIATLMTDAMTKRQADKAVAKNQADVMKQIKPCLNDDVHSWTSS